MEFARVGTGAFIALGLGAVLSFAVPIGIALIWKYKKKEKFTTILTGAAVFLLFALVLEKPIQNILLFPAQMGLADHAASVFVNARPVLQAFLTGLFPGVFEETGRLLTFKTVLKNRKNKETAISYGIGHGGIEVMVTLGITYVTYIVYAVMINSGSFKTLVDQAAAVAPDSAGSLTTLADQIANLSVAGTGPGMAERVFAVLFHIGASILVFYACRDKKKIWLFPLAVILHTAMDFAAGLYMFGIIQIPVWAMEGIFAAFGILTFCGAYFLLYRKSSF